MMARAAAAQKNVYVGIKHKPTEKQKIPSKTAAGKAAAEQKIKLDPRERDKKRRLGSSEAQSGGESDKNAKKRRELTELAYKGTMRPAPKATPSYKGTMGMKRPEADRNRLEERRRSLAGAGLSRRQSYYDEYNDEEEEEEEERGGYDEESDLSDMEANVFDVDEEERKAMKIAKDEDKREQELEARLKREKQAKLKKLQQDAIARIERRRLNGI
jgi:protein SPT2